MTIKEMAAADMSARAPGMIGFEIIRIRLHSTFYSVDGRRSCPGIGVVGHG